MFVCKSCHKEFEKYETFFESHSLLSPPYEEFSVCPYCKSTDFTEIIYTHCKCCGAKLINSSAPYCSEKCRKKGVLLWRKEMQRKKRLAESDIFLKAREIDEFNKSNKTHYSYGVYVAMTEKRGK